MTDTRRSVPDKALRDIVKHRLPLMCVHDRRCACEGKALVDAWLALDALLAGGWGLVPPTSEIGADAISPSHRLEEK